MKKIIYNTKLKKAFIVLLIFMLLLNFIFPNISMADLEDVTIDTNQRSAKGSIQDIIHSMKTDTNDSGSKTLGDIIGVDKATDEKISQIETVAKNEIKAVLSNYKNIYSVPSSPITDQNIDEYVDMIYRYYRYDKNKIEITCNYQYFYAMGANEYSYNSFSARVNTNNLTVEAIDEAYTNCSEQDQIDTKTYIDTRPPSAAIGQDPNPSIDNMQPVDDEEDSANLGGILLSPVFWLFNFIFDAIESNLGNIMMGDGLTLTGGTKLLQDTCIPPSDDSEPIYVSTSSFVLGDIQYPNIKYTPEEIFAGKIDLLSIDFISGKNYEGEQNKDSGWNEIRKVISQWYQILRMIAIIGLLSVLIYTGIKIIISANAKDKAKYKEWIINWLMAVAILFFMHYIMAFTISITGEISKLIAKASQSINVQPSENAEAFSTNLMGLVRFMIQSENFYIKVGYEVMYIALIFYTVKFTFIYLKRVLNMAFLTLIAPIVALTYPIDKINDGKAQGFDMWLKEYIFNALLQPMHQIMYYVLVGSAVSIAAKNPIYGIVVLAFMTEAERLLKKIFGFDKATGGTVGGMANAFAAGAIASNIAKMAKLPKGNASKGGAGGNGDNGVIDAKPTEKPGLEPFNDGQQDDSTTSQRMFDADEENGEFNDNTADSETRERELNPPTPGGRYDGMSDDEYREDLRDNMGMDDETIEMAVAERRRTQLGGQTNGNSRPSNGDSGIPVPQMAANNNKKKEKSRFAKGMGNVGKRLLKPVWDLEHGAAYNGKRLGRKVLKAYAGASLGIASAAVQAGISITDGKYNPMEGIASFAAGYAGGGQLANGGINGIGSLIDAYKEGALPEDSDERKEIIMKRAKQRFGDRDDVIEFNKKNFHGKEKEVMQRQRDNYLTAGITDLKEMKSGIKYANTLVGKTDGMSAEQVQARRREADRKAAATIDFKKRLQDQGQLQCVYNQEKQQKYIQSMVDKAADADKAKVRRQYENAFKSVVAYDTANQ